MDAAAGADQGLHCATEIQRLPIAAHDGLRAGRQLFEIQIRTRDMHWTAEFGIAAHWLYKDGAKNADELERHLSWFRQVLELQLDASTPDEFLEFLKLDLYQDEIFVFTPTG